MASNKLLIRGGQVYDHDGDVHKPAVADILIEGRQYRGRRPGSASRRCAEIIDARDKLVVPGLINAHYHSHDTLCRGLFEELPLEILAALHAADGRQPQQGGAARTHAGRRAGVAPLRHHQRAGHARSGPARRCDRPTS